MLNEKLLEELTIKSEKITKELFRSIYEYGTTLPDIEDLKGRFLMSIAAKVSTDTITKILDCYETKEAKYSMLNVLVDMIKSNIEEE